MRSVLLQSFSVFQLNVNETAVLKWHVHHQKFFAVNCSVLVYTRSQLCSAAYS